MIRTSLNNKINHKKNYTRSFNYIFINIIIFLSTIPYISIYPSDSDIQPLIFIFSFLLLINDLVSKRVQLNYKDIIFIFFSLFSILYFNFNKEFDFLIEKRIAFVFAFTIYYSISRYWQLIQFKYFFYGIIFNFICAYFHYFFPEIFSELFSSNFIRTVKIISDMDFQYRGVSGLTTEPSFLAGMAFYFILFTYWMYSRKKVDIKILFFSIFISLVMIILTKSGSSIILLIYISFFLIIILNFNIIYKILLLILFAFFISLFFYYDWGISNSFSNSRIIQVVEIIKTNPNAIFNDSSIKFRLISLLMGIESFFYQYNFLGNGAGSINYVAEEIAKNSKFTLLNHASYGDVISILSSFGYYLLELGIFFIIFISIFLFFSKKDKYSFLSTYGMLFFILASFSITFPPIWIIWGLTSSKIK